MPNVVVVILVLIWQTEQEGNNKIKWTGKTLALVSRESLTEEKQKQTTTSNYMDLHYKTSSPLPSLH